MSKYLSLTRKSKNYMHKICDISNIALCKTKALSFSRKYVEYFDYFLFYSVDRSALMFYFKWAFSFDILYISRNYQNWCQFCARIKGFNFIGNKQQSISDFETKTAVFAASMT